MLDEIRWEPLENGILLPRDPHFPYTRDVTLLCNAVCSRFDDTPRNVLDLGCGSGAIFLLLAARRATWRFLGVERRSEAVSLAEQGILRNELQQRAAVLADDLRNTAFRQSFDLVVANPPYRVGGKASPDPLREQAVAETDTTIRDFVRAAYGALKVGGTLVIVFPRARKEELRMALQSCGFHSIAMTDPAETQSKRLLCTAAKAEKETKP